MNEELLTNGDRRNITEATNLLMSDDSQLVKGKFLRYSQSMFYGKYDMMINRQYEEHLMDLTRKNGKYEWKLRL